MKTMKKALCLVLSVLMAFSCLTLVASAEGETVKSSFKYYAEKSNAYNAKVTLDKVDEALKKADIHEKVDLGILGDLELDLRSVNALCKTLDDYVGLLRLATFVVPESILGDLKSLNLKSWEEDMRRTGDDILILNEFIELIAANNGLVAKFCDGSINIGVFANYVNLAEILGPDGVSGLLKKFIFGVVYKEGTPEFTNAYNTYKNDVDGFIYSELIPKFTKDPLPGLTVNANSTIEELICNVFDIAIDKYVISEVKKLNVDLATSDMPAAKALAGIVNLKGSTYDLSEITLDATKPLLGQLNGLFGAAVKQVVPGFDGWIDGDYDVIDDNIEAVCKYIGKQSGLIPDADEMSLEELAFEVQRIILENADFGAYEEGLAECETLEEMADVFFRNLADSMNLGINYDKDDSYLVVAGDIFADWFYDRFDVKDLNGKSYRAGGGKDVFDVTNYFLNYFLFDKGVASVMGLKTTKSETAFNKIDKILDYFGSTKSKGVSFDSKEFVLGSEDKKGLLDSILTFDIENLLEITVVPALETAGDVSAIEFLYKSVQYFLNNWAGTTIFPAYQSKAFTNALSNNNVANLISKCLTVVDARSSSVVNLLTFVIGLVCKDAHLTYNVTEASVDDCEATGLKLYPNGSVSLDGKALTKGKDYVISTESRTPGTAKAKIRLVGMYDGEFERDVTIILSDVETAKCTSTTGSIKLTWDEIPYADGYNVYVKNGDSYKLVNDELLPKSELLVSGLTAATEYDFRIDAVSSTYGIREGKAIDVATIPEKVGTIKVRTGPENIRLIWTAVPSATHYKIERYAGSNKWETLDTTTKTDVKFGGHKGYTTYKFRVTALKKLSNGDFVAAAPVSVSAKTTLGPVEKIVTEYTSTSITLRWREVNNAQKYQIYQLIDGKWKSIKVIDAPTRTYTIKNLKAGTKYSFRVRAAVKESKWIYGDFKSVSQYTGLAKPKTLKVSTTTESKVKLAWSKVSSAKTYEVFRYTGGKWVSIGKTKSTSMVVSGLPSGTKFYFKVRARTSYDGVTVVGDSTDKIAAYTLPGQVKSVKLVVRKTTSIKFSWKKVTGAASYQVYRLDNGKWVKLGSTKSLEYTDSKSLKKGTTYQYKVRAVQKVGTTTKYGAFSDVFKAKTTLVGSSKI